jgi:uncharacterized membrane protein
MELNQILGLLSRWAHILPAIVLAGGTLFLRFTVLPANGDATISDEAREAMRKRWVKWVAGSALLLLVSGLYNSAMKAMGYELPMIYNGLLLVKILLAFAAFWLSATLAGRSDRAKRFREREKHWLNVLTVILLLIVLIAGFMKMDSTDYTVKVRDADETTEVEVETAE